MSEIKIVLTKDILESWKILSGAFEHPAPMLDEMYPNRDTPEGDKRIAERLDRKLNKGIGMVSVDAMIDGQLAGVAVWQFMDELPPTDIKKWESDWANTWTDDDERQYLQEMWRGFIKSRYDEVEKALKEGTKVLLLEYLGVNPDFRRRGVGEKLVAWGINQADEHDINTVLEATSEGNKLYKRVGFEEITPITYDGVSSKFDDRKRPELVFMRRLPKSASKA